jgi:hypothetical protein
MHTIFSVHQIFVLRPVQREKMAICFIDWVAWKPRCWTSDAKFPTLRAHRGWDVKSTLIWLGHFTKALDNEMSWALQAICKCIEILDKGGMVLTAREHEALHAWGTLFIQCYLELSTQALAKGKRLWKIRPKFHSLSHLLLPESFLNGRWVSCFGPEDFIGRMCKLCRRCHADIQHTRVVQRYAAGMFWTKSPRDWNGLF